MADTFEIHTNNTMDGRIDAIAETGNRLDILIQAIAKALSNANPT
jgi:hypothetical protein